MIKAKNNQLVGDMRYLSVPPAISKIRSDAYQRSQTLVDSPKQIFSPTIIEDVTIREARLSDARAIAHVHVEAWQEGLGAIMPREALNYVTVPRFEQRWEDILLAQSGLFTLVAEDVSLTLVGFLRVGSAEQTMKHYPSEVIALNVLPSCQGQGIARCLWMAALVRLDALALEATCAWVLAANDRARYMMKHFGGEIVARDYERMGRIKLEKIAYGWHDIAGLVSHMPD